MTSRDFCYWLQGFFELSTASGENTMLLTEDRIELIKNHLAMVFVHEIDPSFGEDNTKLNKIHHTGKSNIIPVTTSTEYRC
jgi:hypothetical protein